MQLFFLLGGNADPELRKKAARLKQRMLRAVVQGSLAGALLGGSMGYAAHMMSSTEDPQRYDFGPGLECLSQERRDTVRETVPEIDAFMETLAEVKLLRLPNSQRSRAAFAAIVSQTDLLLNCYALVQAGAAAGKLGVLKMRICRAGSMLTQQTNLLKEIYLKANGTRGGGLIACDEVCNAFIAVCDDVVNATMRTDRWSFYLQENVA